MRLALVIEAVESVGIGGGAVEELMLLEIAPTSFDVVQLGGVFRQPFESEPGALGEGACCQLAAVDRSVVENCHQGPGAFGGAVRGAELVKRGKSVERLLALVCTRRRWCTGSKAPSMACFFAWPCAVMRRSDPRRAQQRAR
jgi:hypothetical protein